MSQRKRALITGITGQDGSYLAELLLEKGYEVHGIIRRSSSFNTGRIDKLYQDPHEENLRLILHYGDLNDASSLNRILRIVDPHEIYNLGAQSHVKVSFDTPEYTGDVTGLGATRLLEVERPRLFVIDGSKGLRKAIRETFGRWAKIQRCQVHKMRNVLEHLPQSKRPWVRAKINKAWRLKDTTAAKAELEQLARILETDHPGAAASLREGLEETLTVMSLGVKGSLHKTLCSTNPIENLQGTIRRVTRNVKRWRSGSMVIRWIVTALVEAESHFRRVKGYGDLPDLLDALNRAVHSGDSSERKVA